MKRRKYSNKPSEQLVDILIELTDFSWKFGIIISAVFLFLSLYTLGWAKAYNHSGTPNHYLTPFIEQFGWIIYAIPLFLFSLFCLFAWRSIVNYSKHNF